MAPVLRTHASGELRRVSGHCGSERAKQVQGHLWVTSLHLMRDYFFWLTINYRYIRYDIILIIVLLQ